MLAWVIKILQNERTDTSDGSSKEVYCYFKDIAYKCQPHVCNKCHDISIMAYEWKNVELINVKGFD